MWESLVRGPRGSYNPRKFSMMLATFLVALFGYIFVTTPTVAAAEATWENESLSYEGKTYTAVSDKNDLPALIKDNKVYRYTDTSVTPNLAYFIYFPSNVEDPQAAKEATYIRYTLNPPNRYINPTAPEPITVVPSTSTATTEESVFSSSCTIDGIGYIVCPVMHGIAEVMDFVFSRIRGFLTVQPITNSVDNPIYRIWQYSRDLANIAFIIGFLVIIYSYIVGGGFNGYEIRKILPRLAVAAILINVSYILCAIAVDASNIAGYGVNQLFESVRDDVLPGSSTTAEVNWTSVTTWVLAGGVGVGVLANVLPGATMGSAAAAGLWGLLSPFLVGGALLIMVTFFILAARQAIIVLLIAIAPLAFAAFILPNTEKWFEKWRSLFFTMLIMFPAFGAVFGAAQLAGEVLIRTATTIEQVILGLGVMVAPLAITPLLLRLGGGVLNRFGGIVNNRNKGIYDRYKNYNNERRQDFLAKQRRINAERNADGSLTGKRNFMRRAAYRQDLKKYNRGRLREANTEYGNRLYEDNDKGYETIGSRARRQYAQARGRSTYTPSYRYGSAEISEMKQDANLLHGFTEGRHEEHWQNTVQGDARRRQMLSETRFSQGRAKVIDERMASEDESYLQQSIDNAVTPRYAALREARIQTAVNKGVADIAIKAVDAEGSAQLAETVLNNNALKQKVIKTQEFQGRASQANELVEDAAKANWEKVSLNDRTIYSRQLERQANAKELKSLQAEWDSILAEAASGRTDDYTTKRNFGPITGEVTASIDRIQASDQMIAVEEHRKARAEFVGKINLSKSLKTNDALLDRAAGIDENGRIKVISELTKSMSTLHMQNVEAVESVMSNEGYTADEEKKILQGIAVRGGSKPTEMERHAALRRLLLTNGNNWAAQETYDYVISQGLSYNPEANDGKGGYFDENNVEITNPDEISNRRDLQQIWIDAQNKSGLKVDYLSGTQRGAAEAGMLQRADPNRTASEQAIMDDINKAKIKGERIANADIDIIDRQIQVFSQRDAVDALDPAARLKYVETLNRTLSDPLLGGRMSEREWSHSKILANLLDDTDTRPVAEKERYYINRDGERKEIVPVRDNYEYIQSDESQEDDTVNP